MVRAALRPISFASVCSTSSPMISALIRRSSVDAIFSPKDEMPSIGDRHAVRSEDSSTAAITCETLDRCLAEFGWAEKAKSKASSSTAGTMALGSAASSRAGRGPRENARMVLEATGRFPSMSAPRSSARASRPSCAQIAADALELPIERIRVFHGSTDLSA